MDTERVLMLGADVELSLELRKRVEDDTMTQEMVNMMLLSVAAAAASIEGAGPTPVPTPIAQSPTVTKDVLDLQQMHSAMVDEDMAKLGALKDTWVPGFNNVLLQGNSEAVIDYLRPVVDQYPSRVSTYWAYERIGRAYAELDRPEQADAWVRRGFGALEDLVQMHEEKPGSIVILTAFVNLYRTLTERTDEDFQRVLATYDWAAEQPQYARFHDAVLLCRADLYMADSRYKDVVAICDAIDKFYATLSPEENNRFGHLHLKAEALLQLDRRAEALDALEAAKKTPRGQHDKSIDLRIQQITGGETDAPEAASDPASQAGDASAAAPTAGGSCCGNAMVVAAGEDGGSSCSSGTQATMDGGGLSSGGCSTAPPVSIAATSTSTCTCGATKDAAEAIGQTATD